MASGALIVLFFGLIAMLGGVSAFCFVLGIRAGNQ
jgi:hypothetical protein